MSVDERYTLAKERLAKLTKRPTDEDFLEIYALFKQAEFGDNNTDKPGMFDLKGKYKWESWNSKKGMSSEDAKIAYIAKIDKMEELYA